MRALSVMPLIRLARVDPAFQLLDGGLGAVFNASLAQRKAMERDLLPSKGSSAQSKRSGAQPKASAANSMAQVFGKSIEVPSASPPARRGQMLMKKVVQHLSRGSKKMAAQQATLQMFEAFAVERSKVVGRSSIDEGDEESPGGAGGLGDQLGQQLLEDDDFVAWVEENLGVGMERVEKWTGSPKFRERLTQQMLRWPRMSSTLDDTELVALMTSPIASSPSRSQHESGRSPPRQKMLAKAGKSILGVAQVPRFSLEGQHGASGDAGVRNASGSPLRLAAREAAAAALSRGRGGRWDLGRRDSGDSSEAGRSGKCKVVLDKPVVGRNREDFGGVLPALPSFVPPSGSIMSADVASAPEFVYLRRCELDGLVPCQAAWRRFGGGVGIIDVGDRSLSDAEVAAVVETAVHSAAEGHALRVLDLRGNALTDSGLAHIANVVADAPEGVCAQVHSLSLAENTQLRMRSPQVVTQLSRALRALTGLVSLNLSGVVLRGSAVPSIAATLANCNHLRTLSMANCGLGCTDQADCVAVAGLLGFSEPGSVCLTSADFGGNFFGRPGFAAVAAALRVSRLTSLSFAGNSGGRWSACDGADGREQGQRFHPMQFLIEGFQANTSLEHIDLSSSGLGPDSAFVLEDAMRLHPRAKTLLIAENPLGDEGLRCIVRLLVSIGSDVAHCDIRSCREADAKAHQVRFRYSQPGGMYSLNLALPHERAILRTLLRFGAKLRGGALRYLKFDPRSPKPSLELDAATGLWTVPTSGPCTFTFNPPLSEAARAAVQERAGAGSEMRVTALSSTGSMAPQLSSHTSSRHSTVCSGMPRHAPWVNSTAAGGMQMGRAPSDAMSRVSTSDGGRGRRAVVEDVSVMEPAVEKFTSRASSSCSSTQAPALEGDWSEVTRLLREARMQVSALRFPLIRGMLMSLVTNEQQLRFIRACSRDIWFNAAQVSTLCEDRPEIATDLACALIPSIRGRPPQLMLLGSSEFERHSVKIAQSVSSSLWFQEGNLTGRYKLDLSEPSDCAVAENCLLVNAWEVEVGRLLGKPDVSQRGNYEMLRNEEHNEVPFTYTRDWALPSHGRFCFDYSSIRRPLSTETAMPEASEITRFLKSGSYSPSAKLKALRAVSIHIYMSAQQFKNVAMCFPAGEDRQDVFCLLHTRVVDPANLLGPMSLYAPAVFSDEDRLTLFRRVGHLHLLNPLHPDHIPYVCRLGIYEERRVVELLVLLTTHEAGGRVLRHAAGVAGVVPASWVGKGVPCDDMTLAVTYETQTLNMGWRQELAKSYCVGTFSLPVA